MKITMLGCGGSAGLPQIGGVDGRGDWGKTDSAEPRNRRSRASILIQAENGATILVDTGPDLRTQLLANGISRIDAILYTHAHADHVAGLDDVRILNRLCGTPLPAYGTTEVLSELSQRFDYAFKPWKGGFFGRPVLEAREIIPYQSFVAAGIEILPITQDHGYGLSVGFRTGDFAYCTDVVRFEPQAMSALRGIHTWIIDCFTPQADHPTHAGLKTVLGWVEQLAPTRTILTHMGSQMDYATLTASLKPGIEPGYDGLTIHL